jgi:DNA-binding MarR family transcriptional regulator
LSHAALNALAVIEGEGKPLLTGEVAARMHITSGTMTSLLDNLERKALVVRSSDPTDRRRVLVDVTPAAQHVLDAVLPEIQQIARSLFERVTVRRQEELLAILADVRAAIAELPAEVQPAEPRNRPKALKRPAPPKR